jgi:hypothetical protein
LIPSTRPSPSTLRRLILAAKIRASGRITQERVFADSYSETASVLLKHDGAAKLSYSYQNHPKAGEPELQKHQGFCELTFDEARSSAEGHYFNSLGRYSFGRMQLIRAADAS